MCVCWVGPPHLCDHWQLPRAMLWLHVLSSEKGLLHTMPTPQELLPSLNQLPHGLDCVMVWRWCRCDGGDGVGCDGVEMSVECDGVEMV